MQTAIDVLADDVVDPQLLQLQTNRKDWHDRVRPGLRDSNIQKILENIPPFKALSPEEMICHPRMPYATRVENKIYDSAECLSGYQHAVEKKISRLQRKYMDKHNLTNTSRASVPQTSKSRSSTTSEQMAKLSIANLSPIKPLSALAAEQVRHPGSTTARIHEEAVQPTVLDSVDGGFDAEIVAAAPICSLSVNTASNHSSEDVMSTQDKPNFSKPPNFPEVQSDLNVTHIWHTPKSTRKSLLKKHRKPAATAMFSQVTDVPSPSITAPVAALPPSITEPSSAPPPGVAAAMESTNVLSTPQLPPSKQIVPTSSSALPSPPSSTQVSANSDVFLHSAPLATGSVFRTSTALTVSESESNLKALAPPKKETSKEIYVTKRIAKGDLYKRVTGQGTDLSSLSTTPPSIRRISPPSHGFRDTPPPADLVTDLPPASTSVSTTPASCQITSGQVYDAPPYSSGPASSAADVVLPSSPCTSTQVPGTPMCVTPVKPDTVSISGSDRIAPATPRKRKSCPSTTSEAQCKSCKRSRSMRECKRMKTSVQTLLNTAVLLESSDEEILEDTKPVRKLKTDKKTDKKQCSSVSRTDSLLTAPESPLKVPAAPKKRKYDHTVPVTSLIPTREWTVDPIRYGSVPGTKHSAKTTTRNKRRKVAAMSPSASTTTPPPSSQTGNTPPTTEKPIVPTLSSANVGFPSNSLTLKQVSVHDLSPGGIPDVQLPAASLSGAGTILTMSGSNQKSSTAPKKRRSDQTLTFGVYEKYGRALRLMTRDSMESECENPRKPRSSEADRERASILRRIVIESSDEEISVDIGPVRKPKNINKPNSDLPANQRWQLSVSLSERNAVVRNLMKRVMLNHPQMRRLWKSIKRAEERCFDLSKDKEEYSASLERMAFGVNCSDDPARSSLSSDILATINAASNVPSTAGEGDCSLCLDRECDAAIQTCGHLCLCYTCALVIQSGPTPKCPICRQRIMGILKIYKS